MNRAQRQERDRAIGERYRAGESITTLSRAFDLAPKHVRVILDRTGVLPIVHGVRPSVDYPERAAYFAQAYQDGASLQHLADANGLSRQRVQQILIRAGVVRRGVGTTYPNPARDERNDRIIARIAAGDPVEGIAREVGLSRDQVYRIARENGVGRPHKEEE